MLRQNMLQKSKQGHKMQDKWLGPYTIEKTECVSYVGEMGRFYSGKLI